MTLSASFEYLCYGSTAIINILIPKVRGPSLEYDVYRRQILTPKNVPRAEMVNL